MVWTCCVRGCKSNAKRNKGVSFFSFPKNKEKDWMEMLKLTNVTITSNIRICSMHFLENDMYMAGSVRKLRKNAEPIIFNDDAPKNHQAQEAPAPMAIELPFHNQNTFELINVPEPSTENLSYDAILSENRQLKEQMETLKRKNEELSESLEEYKSKYSSVSSENKELRKQLEAAEKSGKQPNRTIFFCCNDDCHV